MGPLSPIHGAAFVARTSSSDQSPVSLKEGLAVTGIATGIGTVAGIGAAVVSEGSARAAFNAPRVSLAIVGSGALIGMLAGLTLLGQ